MKEINFVASLRGPGGGEQSAVKIVQLLRKNNWKVNFIPWKNTHPNYENHEIESFSFIKGMRENMKKHIPLFLYANDNVYDITNKDVSEEIINNSSSFHICINYIVAQLPRTKWLVDTNKLKTVIFHNQEKLQDWADKDIGFKNLKLIPLFGAIDMDRLLQIDIIKRQTGSPFMVARHSANDNRKFVTSKTCNKGEKIHPWQKHLKKTPDIEFYHRLLDNVPNIHFKFMVGSQEMIKEFKNHDRFTFYRWNEMDVMDFLKNTHAYLYRTSDEWRDQYPRVVAEAFASGIPCLGEPRDGLKDRIQHGDNGFYAIETVDYVNKLQLLEGNEELRFQMGLEAKKYAKRCLNPEKWVEIFEDNVF
jgi:glycosyltransferase involved in cell wall biosynthesis